MNINLLREYVENQLKEKLSPHLYYHSLEHTLEVVNNAYILGESEKISDEEAIILEAAALLHDIGFVDIYHGHEEKGCLIAANILPEFGFSDSQIQQVKGIIRATKTDAIPQTQLEKIIVDADFYYLGTNHFNRISSNLFKEWIAHDIVTGLADFLNKQLLFLLNHTYYTQYANAYLAPAKAENIEKTRAELNQLGVFQFNTPTRFQLWQKNRLLENLEHEELMSLATYIRTATYKKGETIINEGDIGDSIFLIEQGIVRIEKENIKLEEKNAGDAFGAMILIEKNVKRSASAVATQDVQVVILPQSALQTLKKNAQPIYYTILENYMVSQQQTLRASNKMGVIDAVNHKSEIQRRMQFGAFITHIVDTISNFVILTDNQLKIMDVNDAWVNLSGYSKTELVDFSIDKFVPNFSQLIETEVSEQGQVLDFIIYNKKKAPIPVQISVKSVFGSDNLSGYIITGSDMTTEYKTRNQLEKYVFELEEKNTFMKHFTYILSHDLKEPLRSMKSFSDILNQQYNTNPLYSFV